jgi:putative tryptophan/tyrosine transport system substrate-binding protein
MRTQAAHNLGKRFSITRRTAILGSAAFALPFGLGYAAQGKKTSATVGWLALSAGPLPTVLYLDSLRDGLRERGWVEGKNLKIDARWGDRDSAASLASEMVSGIDVLVAQGAMVLGASTVTKSVPIVFGFSGDPIEGRLIKSYARPAGNLTGIAMQAPAMVGKRIELLKEIIPTVTRVAIVANPAHPGEQTELRESRSAAQRLGVDARYFPVTAPRDFEEVLAQIHRERTQAVVAFPDALVMGQAKNIAAFSRSQQIPFVSGWSEFVDEGNFLSYGPSLRSVWHQASGFVDRLLRGAKAEELPVEQPSRFELVVNKSMAAALKISLPMSIVVRVDRFVA